MVCLLAVRNIPIFVSGDKEGECLLFILPIFCSDNYKVRGSSDFIFVSSF